MPYLIGALLGVVVGATGIGGGAIAVPALIVIFGVPSRIAIGTALIFSAALKIVAAALYLVRKQVNLQVLIYLVTGGLPGALLGAVILESLHGSRTNAIATLSLGAIIIVSAVYSLHLADKASVARKDCLGLLSILTFPIGIETGVSSVGAGGLGTLILLNLTTLTPAVVVGTDIVFGLAITAVAGGVHAFAGSCDWYLIGRLLPTGVVGVVFGHRVSRRLPTAVLRKVVVCSIIALGAALLAKGIATW